jgi:hypothetical protein
MAAEPSSNPRLLQDVGRWELWNFGRADSSCQGGVSCAGGGNHSQACFREQTREHRLFPNVWNSAIKLRIKYNKKLPDLEKNQARFAWT